MMRKKYQTEMEDAKLSLQSQPLDAVLWDASTNDIKEIAFRLPDPSYSDSFHWPKYNMVPIPEFIEGKITSSNDTKLIENPVEAMSSQLVQTENEYPQQDLELSKQRAIETTAFKNQTSKAKIKKGRKVISSTLENKEIEEKPEILDVPIVNKVPEKKEIIRKGRNTKNLDFYAWLEEQNNSGKGKTQKRKAVKQKSYIKEIALKTDDTKKSVESSLQLGKEVVSETLAKLLARQGYVGESVEMYQKLILKYPEKSATFAAAILKLKS